MKNSKELMKKAGIVPKLRLGIKKPGGGVESTGKHTVKMVEDKLKKSVDINGEQIEVVRYIVEEDGEERRYDVPVRDESGDLHYLVQRLAEVDEGERVVLEMQSRGAKNFIVVSRIDGTEISEGEVDEVFEGEDDD